MSKLSKKREYFLAKKERKRQQEIKSKESQEILSRKKIRNPLTLIDYIYRGKSSGYYYHKDFNLIEQIFKISPIEDREFTYKFIVFLYEKTSIFEANINVRFLIQNIITYKKNIIRDFDQWTKKSYNANKQVSSLLRHLFCKYDVPIFMDKIWWKNLKQTIYFRWFFDIALGKNIRKSELLPMPLTKANAHYFLQAPDNCEPEEAIRWGQVRSLQGDIQTAQAILGTRIATNFEHNDFWSSVIRFFIANPMLDKNQYAPIIDYIYNIRFAPIIRSGDTWIAEQPNFSMHKRDPNSLMNKVEEWHKKLSKEKMGNASWTPSKYHIWSKDIGEPPNQITWSIIEIVNKKELQEEGRILRHCVASYAGSCSQGLISIWSLRKNAIRQATIEVNNSAKKITQARGKFNAPLSNIELNFVALWAKMNGLTISTWLV